MHRTVKIKNITLEIYFENDEYLMAFFADKNEYQGALMIYNKFKKTIETSKPVSGMIDPEAPEIPVPFTKEYYELFLEILDGALDK